MSSQTPLERAQAAVDAFAAIAQGIADVDTGQGIVRITSVELVETEFGGGVSVRYGNDPGVEPVFVINPPNHLPDPDGPIEVNGNKYRYDPLAALALVIKTHAGGVT